MHELNKPLREGFRGIFFVGVMRGGGERVHIDILSNPHGSFGEGGVSGGDSDITGDCSGSPAWNDEGGESAIVLDKVAGTEVMTGDDGGRAAC
jgi:hypothetical protein